MSATTRTVFWAAIGLLIATASMTLQFRLSPGEIAEFAFTANAPRWLLAFTGGAFLAVAGVHLQSRLVSPLWLLGVSTGGVLGAALGFLAMGSTGSWLGFLLGVTLPLLVLNSAPRHSVLGALACLSLAAIGIYGVSLVKAEPNAARALVFFAAGDVGHATFVMSLAGFTLLVVSLVFRTSAALGPAALGPIALGFGIGLVGPVAFISWWVPLAEERLTRLTGVTRLCMVAFAGGVVLITADAVQRYFIGGYGFGLNFPLTLVGTPVYLWWCAGLSTQVWVKVTARFMAVLVAVLAAMFSTFAIRTIQQAT